MSDIKQIRQKYNILTESKKAENDKLTALVRAGLFEENKIAIVKRALQKDPSKMTIAERKVAMSLLESLMENFLSQNYDQLNEKADHLSKFDPRFKNTVTDKDMPVVIILKRKAIRVYPDNQKVALYYSQALDKYVTIPFGPNRGSINESRSEESRDREKGYTYKRFPDDETKTAYSDVKARLQLNRERIAKGGLDPRAKRTILANIRQGKSRLGEIEAGSQTVNLSKMAPSELKSKDEYKQLQNAIKNDPSITDPFLKLAIRTGVRHGYKSAQRKAASSPTPTPTPSVTESFRQKLSIKKYRMQEEDSSDNPWARRGRGALDALIGEPVSPETRQMEIDAARASAMRRAPAAVKELMKKPEVQDKLKKTDQSVAAAQKAEQEAAAAARDTPEFKQGQVAGTVAGLVGAGGAIKAATSGAKATSKFGKLRQKVERRRALRRVGRAAADIASSFAGAGGDGKDGAGQEKLPRAQAREFNPNLGKAVTPEFRPTGLASDPVTQLRYQQQFNKSLNENIIDNIKKIADGKLTEAFVDVNGTSVKINTTIASKIVETYNNLNNINKKKMSKMMNESVDSFKQIINFVARQ